MGSIMSPGHENGLLLGPERCPIRGTVRAAYRRTSSSASERLSSHFVPTAPCVFSSWPPPAVRRGRSRSRYIFRRARRWRYTPPGSRPSPLRHSSCRPGAATCPMGDCASARAAAGEEKHEQECHCANKESAGNRGAGEANYWFLWYPRRGMPRHSIKRPVKVPEAKNSRRGMPSESASASIIFSLHHAWEPAKADESTFGPSAFIRLSCPLLVMPLPRVLP